MNDQIKPAPLQGKVILEPALAAQEERAERSRGERQYQNEGGEEVGRHGG